MGDIVNSSDAPSANGLHRTFNMAVEEANRRHAKDILSRLTITLGDEFQGVTRGLRQAANIARELRLQLMLADVDCRFVVGTVDIQTPINAERAWNMMGPGLAEARTKLSEKRLESLYAFSLPREPATQALLDAVGAGLTATERRWTKIQLHDIAHTLLGKSAQDIAQIRNVTAHSVYKVRAAGDFDSYILQWNRLLEALDIMDEGGVAAR
ncbi:SatD family protein [Novosphingobium pokkalii]|uniref:SatD family protein n=1 Tax=Novosphingobium pokkalii TaxID=1770194 RepID=A0ABV7V3F1_9SPHN|nr:SatD family protein [Novosphingobium pokkalii]GHC90201.1 hypothetical protein GCM10019060_14390 [Novosphingobium pokkalii]